MSLRRRRVPVLVLLLLLALLGCTDGEPAPAPDPAPEPTTTPTGPAGLRAGIVLPPAVGADDPQAAQLNASMRPLQAMLPEEITQLRHVTADGPAFVGDLARLLVDRGTELVCMVGSDVIRVANQLAARHPERTFCVAPGDTSERPDNVRVVDVRFEELGHVAGVAAASAAATAAEAAAAEDADENADADADAAADAGTVAFVLSSDRLGNQRFRDGVRAGVGQTELLEWFPQSPEAARDAVDQAVAAGAEVLILDVGWQPSELLTVAAEAGLGLIAPMTALAGSRFEDATILAWTVRWELVLGPVVARLVDSDIEIVTSAGLSEDVFVLTPGPLANRAALDQVVADLRDGRRQAAPQTEEPAPTPSPSEDGGEGEDEDGTEGEDGA